jgi:hypothetical protein
VQKTKIILQQQNYCFIAHNTPPKLPKIPQKHLSSRAQITTCNFTCNYLSVYLPTINMAKNSSNSLLRTIIGVIVLLIGGYLFQKMQAPTAVPTNPNAPTAVPVPPNASPQQTPPNNSPSIPQSGKPSPTQPQQPGRPNQPAEEGNELNHELSSQKLYYTKHARCRMDCRNISETEVRDILQRGKENRRKSEPNAPDCPKYALEGVTKDGQKVRMIFADCNNETRVITVIDLNNEHYCDCK